MAPANYISRNQGGLSMLHVHFIPWALALLDFIRVSVDIIGNGNDCLKIAWTKIIGNEDIQTLFETACEQTLEIKALIEKDITFNRVVLDMLTAKIFHARANVVIKQYSVFISKQSVWFRAQFKADSKNKSNPSQRQQTAERPQSSITSSNPNVTTRVEKKKKALAIYPDRTEPGVNKKRALESVLHEVRHEVRQGRKIIFNQISSVAIPPTTYNSQTGFIFHSAAASAAEDMEE
jgi:hypothetical protein